MRIRSLLIIQIILIPLTFSCRSTRHLSKTTPQSREQRTVTYSTVEQSYIDTYSDIAMSEMKRTGIPASITLAQGMIESDNGRSQLAKDANNHFGIKCHNNWTGPKVYHHDDARDECFRKYNKPEDSFYDHSEFLRTVPRYKFLFGYSPTDYKSWALGLKKAGYATNPEYANMLIRTIEEKNLSYFDSGIKPAELTQTKQPRVQQPVAAPDIMRQNAPATPINDKSMVITLAPRVRENNNLRFIVVKDGDTREKIEEEFQLLHWELLKYNDISGELKLAPGQILYLQAKKDKAGPGIETYIAGDGDTMYLISQKFGIKLRSLCKMNRMTESDALQPGTTIWLRSMKPLN